MARPTSLPTPGPDNASTWTYEPSELDASRHVSGNLMHRGHGLPLAERLAVSESAEGRVDRTSVLLHPVEGHSERLADLADVEQRLLAAAKRTPTFEQRFTSEDLALLVKKRVDKPDYQVAA
jgi:hypothetical protein